MQLEQPRIRDVLALGESARDWERIFDEAVGYRHDEAVLRVLEQQELRKRYLGRRPPGLIRRPNARGGANVVSIAAQFRALFQKDIGGVAGVSDSWFDANYYAVDGVSGKVSDFVDYIDPTHTLHAATTGNQVAVPSPVAAFGGALGGAFLGSTVDGQPDYYVSTRTAAAWNFLISGAGSDLALTLSPTVLAGVSIYLCTITGSAIRGVQIYASTASPVYLIVAGSSGNTSSATSLAINTGAHLRCTYLTSDSPRQVFWQGGVNVASASPNATASDGERPLTLGARDTGSSPAQFNFRGLTAHRRRLNSAERATQALYTTATTGIPVTP